MSRGKRRRLATGIYRDACGIALVVWSHGHRLEHRVADGAELADYRAMRKRLQAEATATTPAPSTRGTLAADVEKYLKLARHLADWTARRSELRAWLAALGARRHRATVRRQDVLQARSAWITAGVAPKTVNNRIAALRAVWRALDGPEAPCPADKIAPLRTVTPPPVPVSPDVIAAVYDRLVEAERRGLLRDAKTRARFLLRAETGRRPCEIMRAQPGDFDLARGVWHVRDAKGGYTPGGVYLTDPIRAAVEAFVAADAFGPWDTGSMARVLRSAGWPVGVRPYQLRHSLGIALADAGADHEDIAAVLGHRDSRTTRRHYIGIRESRTRAALERIGARVAPARGTGAQVADTMDDPRGRS